MYEEHPGFKSPNEDATLWRCMDFTKFVSLLETQSLYFARADRLGDPFDGSYSRANTALRPALYEWKLPDADWGRLWSFFKAMRQFTLINCWHESDHESAAMWRLYSREHDGIAVKTNFRSLTRSFTCGDVIHIGKVDYVDYNTTFIPEGNSFYPYPHKRQSFEHEREVRAITLKIPDGGVSLDMPQETGATGSYCAVDLSLLIEEVIVAPYADSWFLELVQAVAVRYGLTAPVSRSGLSESPTWN